MQPIQLKPGMRVRCVNAGGVIGRKIRVGEEYVTRVADCWKPEQRIALVGVVGVFYPHRFKPIVRVKAPYIPSLDLMIRRAVAAVEAMTPAQRAEMHQAQRESWVRGEMGMGDEGTRVLP
jgi:hypothetical protein